MKKRSLVIGGIVLACLAGGGVVLTSVLEQKAEQQVRDALAATSAVTAESVSYSLWGNQLDISGIKFEFEVVGQKWKGSANSASLSGFDPDSLNPDVKGLPRVAETLVMTGIAWDTSMGDPKSAVYTSVETTLEEVRMEDWYQSLGRLLGQKWGSEAFWAELYHYKLAMLSYKNYDIKFAVHDSEPFTEHIAFAGLLGPVDGAVPASAGGENLGGRKFSLFANDITFDMSNRAKIDMKRMEMRDIVMPAPADMVFIMEINKKIMEEPDNMELPMQLLERLGTTYATVSPCRTFMLQGMNIAIEDLPTIRMQELEQTLEIDAAVRFGISLAGLNVAVTKEQLAQLEPFDAFLPKAETEGLTTDFAFMLTASPESVGASRLDWSTNAFGLADGKGSVDFMLDVASLKDFLLPTASFEQAFKFKETTLDYTDNGLVAAAVAAYGKDVGISAQESQQALLAQVPMVLGVAGPLGEPLLEALTTMLETPGKLTASLSFAKAVLGNQALLMLLMEPESVTLKAQAEPGKPFADWLPASLK